MLRHQTPCLRLPAMYSYVMPNVPPKWHTLLLGLIEFEDCILSLWVQIWKWTTIDNIKEPNEKRERNKKALNYNTVQWVSARTFCIPLESRCGTDDGDARGGWDEVFTWVTRSFVVQSVVMMVVVVVVRFGPIVFSSVACESSHSSNAVEVLRFESEWSCETYDDFDANINSSILLDVFVCDDKFE